MSELPVDDDGNSIVRIGHSPDPDDAFMFHAMTNEKFPTPGYKFVHEECNCVSMAKNSLKLYEQVLENHDNK